MTENNYIKGRGAQFNTPNKFEKAHSEKYFDHLPSEKEQLELAIQNPRTRYIEVYPKTILNKVKSPDIPMGYSMNPYQGCEHGCIYCYARNTHQYWGYSAGQDFETKILIKKNAPKLLETKLKSKKWKAQSIMLAGNTDCYQPAERKFKITRELLKVFYKYRHPVGIITKNSLVERDIDILADMAKKNLVTVGISFTTLDKDLKQAMEPRTSSPNKILRTIKRLRENHVPVTAMHAPIIPGLNSDEIFKLVEQTANAGVNSIGYTIVRLNDWIGPLFEDWITKNFPDKAKKVLNQIAAVHGGRLNDSRWGIRTRGEGKIAEMIHAEFRIAKKRFLKNRFIPSMNYNLYEQYRDGQIRMF